MKCFETEKLIRYAYHLTEESAAAEVRTHLGECPRCRGIVEQYGRLGSLLEEWPAAEPTPEFEARVRHAVEAEQARRAALGIWGLGWARGLAVASLGVLIVAGAVWFTQVRQRGSNSTEVAHRKSLSALAPATPATKLPTLTFKAPVGAQHTQVAPQPESKGAFSNEDQEALALEDYDLAANFDLLSELPRGDQRVVN